MFLAIRISSSASCEFSLAPLECVSASVCRTWLFSLGGEAAVALYANCPADDGQTTDICVHVSVCAVCHLGVYAHA